MDGGLGNGKGTLLVAVPAISGGLRTWRDLLDRLKSEPPLRHSTQLLRWEHKHRWYSHARAYDLAVELRAAIDQAWTEAGGFSNIILIGHSFGALIARQAYLLALGADHLTRRRSPWADHVTRVVLLAGISRGVNTIDPDVEEHPYIARFLRLSNWLFRLAPILRRLLIYDATRGSDFVTNLRIQWLRGFSKIDKPPLVVQLLGTRDGLVRRDDSVDLEQFPTAWHVDVPGATHGNLHRLDLIEDPDARYSLIRSAFLDETPANGENVTITGADRVIFVLHGIRANNRTWVKDVAELIEKHAPSVTVATPTYGFLSAAMFAWPMARRKQLPWFQDAYSQYLARNPKTEFGFVGHSNGTYLLGHSLRKIPGMQFGRAVLAGSVLPTAYPWQQVADRGQIAQVVNLRSCRDFPVSFLCSALRGLGMRDVGTGGYEGFFNSPPNLMQELFWYDGGHSCPLEHPNLGTIADYVLGVPAQPPPLTGREEKRYNLYPRIAPWIARVGLAVVIALIWWVSFHPSFSIWRLAAAVAAIAIVYVVLDIF